MTQQDTKAGVVTWRSAQIPNSRPSAPSMLFALGVPASQRGPRGCTAIWDPGSLAMEKGRLPGREEGLCGAGATSRERQRGSC